MKTIDSEVLSKYNAGVEKNRLHSGLGLIEFARTKEILLEMLPKPPAVIYDIGGGYGEYSYFLAKLGYEVHLFDISETNIKMAKDYMVKIYPDVTLKAIEVADARSIKREDSSADAILLMGPLYHIVEEEERLLALKECFRLLKDNGKLFTSAITRYASILWAMTTYGHTNFLLDEKEFQEMVEKEIKDGHHIKPEKSKYQGIGRSYFHNPKDLKEELSLSGFKGNDIRGIIGGAWLVPNIDDLWKSENSRESILKTVRLLEKEDDLIGLSTHLLSISTKN